MLTDKESEILRTVMANKIAHFTDDIMRLVEAGYPKAKVREQVQFHLIMRQALERVSNAFNERIDELNKK
jgi:hypothetical protein